MTLQGLKQKTKVDINGERGAQISIEAKKIATDRMTLKLRLWSLNKLYTIFIFLFSHYYVHIILLV